MNIVVDVSAGLVETLTITVLAREGSSMAPKLVTKAATPAKAKVVAKAAAPAKAKAAAKKAAPAKAAAKKTAAAAETSKPATSRSRLPSATIRALKEVEAGKLTRYADEDDLFKKLGIKLGED
jgi:guanyl-specific ribonuclease Sa